MSRTSLIAGTVVAALLVGLGLRFAEVVPVPRPLSNEITQVVVNGRIWTGEAAQPWAEAMAISGDRLAVVGTNEEVRAAALAQDVATLDARGRLVVPGFIDSHVHFIEGGFRLASVQLRDAATKDEFVSRIRAFAGTVPAGTWITGGDWDHSLWGGEPPARAWIDAATPNHPVWVNRLDGHMALANSAALALAGVSRDTADVEGGTIDRDANGDPTGLLRDNAMSLVERVVPPPSDEMNDRALAAAMRYVAERGVTSVHHMGTWDDLAVFERAWRQGTLATRIYAAVPLPTWARLRDRIASGDFGADGRGDAWLRIGALKGFVDGSLGSHTAAFLDPFTDAPDDVGLLVNTPDDLFAWISGADEAGLQVVVHAIGDRANRLLLDLYARVAAEHGPRDRRFRIEHAQHLSPADIPRFAALDVIPSLQPYHAIDDGRWAEKVIGPERIKTTYAFKALVESGARLAFGSDWFVAPPTPLEGIYAAVTRRTLDGGHPDGWVPEQKISVEQTLLAYTRDAAYASFDEKTRGTLRAGKLADFVVLEADILSVPPETIRDVKVDLTVVGGRTVYQRAR
jgi:hypothetical protein